MVVAATERRVALNPSQCDRILLILNDRAWHPHRDFYGFCVLHSRISDLRKRGYVIEMKREAGAYWYRLVSAPVRDGVVDQDVTGSALTPAASPSEGVSSAAKGDAPLPVLHPAQLSFDEVAA